MATTRTRIKRFEQRVKEEVEKRKRIYAKQLEHTRQREEAIKQHANETAEEREKRQTAVATFYSVFFINDIVGSIVVDFCALARKDKDIYRLTEKREIEQLEQSRLLYEKRIDNVAKFYGYYLYDMLDYASDVVKLDVLRYRNAIQMQFTKNKLPKYELLALLETARSLAWYANQLCDSRIKHIKEVEKAYYQLELCRITSIENKLTALANKLYKRYCPAGVKIELYKDTNAANGVQIIANKLESGETIAAAIQFADNQAEQNNAKEGKA